MTQQNKRSRRRTARVATREMVRAMEAHGSSDCLVVIYSQSTDEITRRFVLDADVANYVIGRSSQCDIVVDSNVASRKHARIDRVGDIWLVADLGSTNGTYVNDEKVVSHQLAHGDRIQIGDTIFKHLSGQDVEAAYAEAIQAALVTDGLTQAANERHFRELLQQAVGRAQTEGVACSLVIADIDHFKAINDKHGHPAGDRVLREFVRTMKSVLPDDVVLARIGGEEFALLCTGRDENDATALAERARGAVESHPFAAPDGYIHITASYGVAQWKASDENATKFFERADQCLYAAKRGGRNRVVRAAR